MPDLHVFDPHLETATAWLNELGETLAIAPAHHPQRTLRALRAGLHAIRDRLPAKDVVELGNKLPTLIRGVFYEAWKFDNDHTRIRDPEALLARVAQKLATERGLDPAGVLRAVIQLLGSHVPSEELSDITATLPRSIAIWWATVPRDFARASFPR